MDTQAWRIHKDTVARLESGFLPPPGNQNDLTAMKLTEAAMHTYRSAWIELRERVRLAYGHRRLGHTDALALRPDEVAALILRERQALAESGQRSRDLAAAHAEIEALRAKVAEADLEHWRIASELRRAQLMIQILEAT
jgi:hypothetical protein